METTISNNFTPAYAIYEQDTLSKVALINFMDDNQKGANDLEVTIRLPNCQGATVGEIGHFNPPPGGRENVPLSSPFRDTLGGHMVTRLILLLI
jgi:hypothetical protein